MGSRPCPISMPHKVTLVPARAKNPSALLPFARPVLDSASAAMKFLKDPQVVSGQQHFLRAGAWLVLPLAFLTLAGVGQRDGSPGGVQIAPHARSAPAQPASPSFPSFHLPRPTSPCYVDIKLTLCRRSCCSGGTPRRVPSRLVGRRPCISSLTLHRSTCSRRWHTPCWRLCSAASSGTTWPASHTSEQAAGGGSCLPACLPAACLSACITAC